MYKVATSFLDVKKNKVITIIKTLSEADRVPTNVGFIAPKDGASDKNMEEYKEIVWDPEDLISSKNAIRILLNMGVSEEILFTLNFGNLDVASVIDDE